MEYPCVIHCDHIPLFPREDALVLHALENNTCPTIQEIACATWSRMDMLLHKAGIDPRLEGGSPHGLLGLGFLRDEKNDDFYLHSSKSHAKIIKDIDRYQHIYDQHRDVDALDALDAMVAIGTILNKSAIITNVVPSNNKRCRQSIVDFTIGQSPYNDTLNDDEKSAHACIYTSINNDHHAAYAYAGALGLLPATSHETAMRLIGALKNNWCRSDRMISSTKNTNGGPSFFCVNSAFYNLEEEKRHENDHLLRNFMSHVTVCADQSPIKKADIIQSLHDIDNQLSKRAFTNIGNITATHMERVKPHEESVKTHEFFQQAVMATRGEYMNSDVRMKILQDLSRRDDMDAILRIPLHSEGERPWIPDDMMEQLSKRHPLYAQCFYTERQSLCAEKIDALVKGNLYHLNIKTLGDGNPAFTEIFKKMPHIDEMPSLAQQWKTSFMPHQKLNPSWAPMISHLPAPDREVAIYQAMMYQDKSREHYQFVHHLIDRFAPHMAVDKESPLHMAMCSHIKRIEKTSFHGTYYDGVLPSRPIPPKSPSFFYDIRRRKDVLFQDTSTHVPSMDLIYGLLDADDEIRTLIATNIVISNIEEAFPHFSRFLIPLAAEGLSST